MNSMIPIRHSSIPFQNKVKRLVAEAKLLAAEASLNDTAVNSRTSPDRYPVGGYVFLTDAYHPFAKSESFREHFGESTAEISATLDGPKGKALEFAARVDENRVYAFDVEDSGVLYTFRGPEQKKTLKIWEDENGEWFEASSNSSSL